jgi:hypothetical protein
VLLTIIGAEISSAQPKVIDFDQSFFLYPDPHMSPRGRVSFSPSAYINSLTFKSKRSFLTENLDIKMRTVGSSSPGDLLTAETLAIESKFSFSKPLSILAKFENRIPTKEDWEIKNYSVLIGPSIEIEDFKMQATYRRKAPRLVNESQGFFFDLDYRLWKYVYLSTSADRQWNNTSTTTHGIFKLSISPVSFASVITGMEFGDSNSWGANNLYRTTHTYFARLHNKWRGYMTSINCQFESLHEHQSSAGDSSTLTAEIRKIWTDIEAWFKGGLVYKEARAHEDRHFAELGVNYDLFTNLELQLKNSYEGYNLANKGDQIRFGGGVNFKIPLPFGMEFQNSLIVNKTIEDNADYQLIYSIKIPKP